MEEIGRRLRAAREQKGLSLEVVEDETKIRRKYIEALEAGDEAELPGDAYLKGFLRTYGNYLGLDGPALVEEYKHGKAFGQESGARREPITAAAGGAKAEELPSANESRTASAPARPAPAPAQVRTRPARPVGTASAGGGARAQEGRPSARPRPRTGSIRPTESGLPREVRRGLTIVVGLALLAAIGYYGWQVIAGLNAKPEPKDTTPPAPPTQTTQQPQPTTPPPQLPAEPKVAMTQNGTSFLFAVPADQVDVTLNAGRNLWIRATVDGKVAEETEFTGTRHYKGGQIKLELGHMSQLTLTVNGQTFDQFPKTGGPYTVTLGKQ